MFARTMRPRNATNKPNRPLEFGCFMRRNCRRRSNIGFAWLHLLIGELDAGVSKSDGDFVPFAAGLNVRGVRARNRAAKPVLCAMGVDPMPRGTVISVGGRDIGRLAMGLSGAQQCHALHREGRQQ